MNAIFWLGLVMLGIGWTMLILCARHLKDARDCLSQSQAALDECRRVMGHSR
jgi:hypothetical protein